MPNLKEVRLRIESVKSTQQITSAMKMVAASKLRRAQQAIVALRPYAVKMSGILQNLQQNLGEQAENPYITPKPVKKVLIVVLASNRGLCGAFNTNVIKAVKGLLETRFAGYYEHGNLGLLCAGKHATDFFVRRGYPVIERHDELFEKMSFEKIAPLARKLMDFYVKGEYDQIVMVYNQFKNAAVQLLVTEQLLPLPLPETTGTVSNVQADYIFEPGKKEILDEIIPKALTLQVYKAFIDSFASEQGARMTAMHQATDNAGELIKQLKLSYNKARQSAITNEIIEIVGGAEAQRG
ncbi:MAG TPA: ATP synthase F1 subunit gamma [Bacteroidales bacterium]|nr:MAG: ATP synthase F1 subunit gamma [Bacteroidetes bacterium GWE2_42_24]OFY27558.1 MAG: ATP synthase F1 subunit gamma [Bacteroidetes bacterium GWF2_43_11]PKP16304.1 MAG: ATP synthase F1 subunit gamma [Bacteroidetes bacterium HGW-Bacteroidetes-22]HAQ64962.1 ATP synthase F1 subunit gamma [Bacteroidales bacterium]HBZ66082.1 ATP synthase F1 subunit gamma [Bacteroidales bacterium]